MADGDDAMMNTPVRPTQTGYCVSPSSLAKKKIRPRKLSSSSLIFQDSRSSSRYSSRASSATPQFSRLRVNECCELRGPKLTSCTPPFGWSAETSEWVQFAKPAATRQPPHLPTRRRSKSRRTSTSTDLDADIISAGVDTTFDTGAAGSAANELRVVTYNVWFDKLELKSRCSALMSIVRKARPHVICFQEVTPDFIEQILKIDWVRQEYFASHKDVIGWLEYRVAILVKRTLNVREIIEHELESKMERTLVSLSFVFNGRTIVIATTHLESREKNAEYRATQLTQIEGLLLPSSHADKENLQQRVSPVSRPTLPSDASLVVLCGDFNFCARNAIEETRADTRWQDSWSCEEPGYTYDTTLNEMAKHGDSEMAKQARLDRVLYFSKDSNWTCPACEILGQCPIDDIAGPIFPSDHFGLLSKLKHI